MTATNEGGLAQSGNSDKAKTDAQAETTINPEFTGVPIGMCLGCLVDHDIAGDEWHLMEPERIDLDLGAAEVSKGTDNNGPFFSVYVNVEAEIMPEEMEAAAQKFERLAAALRAFGAGE
jgi:hypothetical protein